MNRITPKKTSMRRLCALGIVGLLATSPTSTTADVLPSIDQLITLLELDPSLKERALSGEIVTFEREDSMKKELAVALLVSIDAPYGEIIDAMKGNRLFQFHEHILDFVEIEGVPDASKFGELGYTAADAKEVRALLAVKPGKSFNLSAAEIVRFQQLQTEAEGLNDAALIETVNIALHEFLAERLRSYQTTGLDGIATYQRKRRNTSSPAEELSTATLAVADMRQFAPDFHDVLESFPDTRIQEVQHRFYVFKFDLAERPGFALVHRIYLFGDEFTLAAERHIYAPHLYNSLQTVAGLIPHEDSTMLFYVTRTYTDLVAGFGSGLKHAFGGKLVAKGVKALLGNVRAGIESGKANEE